ncbi:MAG: hypothetical protein DRH12_01790 [Deltaproteobacteria bacterium]|nr:MAG: hypothetical protein DRH12_01790 [Deltaproteobacteria bacterium]
MGQRMPRILLAKLGHGHKEALLNLAKRLGDAGFEIVYTELEDPAAIVGTAIQESVDHIGITVLEDGDISNVRRIKGLLDQGEESHVTIAVGGLMNDRQLAELREVGVDACFPKGTSFDELARWARENITSHGPAAALGSGFQRIQKE